MRAWIWSLSVCGGGTRACAGPKQNSTFRTQGSRPVVKQRGRFDALSRPFNVECQRITSTGALPPVAERIRKCLRSRWARRGSPRGPAVAARPGRGALPRPRPQGSCWAGHAEGAGAFFYFSIKTAGISPRSALTRWTDFACLRSATVRTASRT